MADKKIVSIEDRIPQLKQARKKKANRRFIIYLTLIILLILIIVYMQSPLSHVKSVTVVDNEMVDEETIISYSKISFDESFWNVDTNDVMEKIEQHPEIRHAEINRSWYNTFVIAVQEFERVAYQRDGDYYYPILQNGNKIEEVQLDHPREDAPLLHGFEDEMLQSIAYQLSQIPESINLLISEVYWEPEESNRERIRLFTIDGQEVIGVISNFSSKMSAYPSIASQLSDDIDGILHLDVGAYFVPYEGEDVEEAEELEFDEEV
ncbi:cell division protein FtsQ/DivIB [Alkalibacillus haloalkaliphilus]|uniref:Cell division protein DivIB n=1 Tax=Alkalibacillus haloalkaliphilus TaxID=94136 RepID=A0A511W1A1_9BACI|nr:FtsQ-type POTRA domain-containing protein [Alkalibacillus haloalkaliphilus]GEN44824.1 cell division protein DivIB [Alkalibacillus haloalkaliphilus]